MARSSDTQPRRSLAIGLLRAREAVMSHFRPLLSAHDVTEQQWRVLRALAEAGTLDATEVSEKAFILAPSLTRIIKALVERKLIRRERDGADGRRVLLTIEPAGQAIIAAVMPLNREVYQRIGADYGEERMQLLLDMLDDLAQQSLGSMTAGEDQ